MNDEKGFTLIEVLVALVAGGLLLASLGWISASLAEELQQTRMGKGAQIDAVAPFIRQMLEEAVPPGPQDVVVARADLLEVVIPAPDALGRKGPVRLTLAAKRTAAGMGLFAHMRATHGGMPLPDFISEEWPLADGFANIHFRYRARGKARRPSLPAVVTIMFVEKSGRMTPMSAEPRLTADATCVFDPISLECRL